MNRLQKSLCIVGAMLAIAVALVAPSAFACDGQCGGGQVFSAPVYAPQVFAAPVYQPQVFAAPVYQRQVFAAPVYAPQRAIVQKQVIVQKAQRQPLFGSFRSRSVNVQRNVQRGVVANAAVVY